MSALNFPASPSDGDTYLGYVYDATDGVWNANPRQLASRFITSATQPPTPQNGDGWFNTTNGKTFIYYYDGTSGQWIESGYPVLGYQSIENLSDTSINTPTNGQVLAYDDGNFVNQNIAKSQLPEGNILQVKSTIKTDAFTTPSLTFTPITGLTATITPSSTSSRIIIMASIAQGGQSALAAHFRFSGGNSTTFVGDASGSIIQAAWGGSDNANNARRVWAATMNYVDSPNTTGAVTYGIETRAGDSGTVYVNRDQTALNDANSARGASSIILMEVAG
jgi:hypothetical protein